MLDAEKKKTKYKLKPNENIPRIGSSNEVGTAQIHCHEPEKYAIRKWREDHPFLRHLLDQLLSLLFPINIHAKNLITAC